MVLAGSSFLAAQQPAPPPAGAGDARPPAEPRPDGPAQMRRARPQGERPPGHHPHAGDWLRRLQSLPPEEQERALVSDPFFQSLPPEHQEKLRRRLNRFNSLPPEERQRILDRMAKFDEMSPERRRLWMSLQRRLRSLPGDRRAAVRQAFRSLMQLPPDQRPKALQAERIKQGLNPVEQDLLNEMVANAADGNLF
jgi:hypothetical protein